MKIEIVMVQMLLQSSIITIRVNIMYVYVNIHKQPLTLHLSVQHPAYAIVIRLILTGKRFKFVLL